MSSSRIAFFALALVALLASPANAQTLCSLPVSAYLSDADGAALDGALDIELRFFLDAGEGAPPAECRSFDAVPVDAGWLRVDVDACSVPEPTDCGTMPISDILRGASGLWVAVVVDDTELGPRLPVGAVPYAVEASNSATLQGLGADAFEDAGSVEAHAGDPDAHHSSTSDGIAITPASVEVGDTRVESGSVDLGPDATDELTAEIVETLTGGGEADALHGHAGMSAGGGCYVAVGINTCATDFEVAYTGIYGDWITHWGSASMAATPSCLADAAVGTVTGASGWAIEREFWTGHGANRTHVAPTDATVACAVCCR